MRYKHYTCRVAQPKVERPTNLLQGLYLRRQPLNLYLYFEKSDNSYRPFYMSIHCIELYGSRQSPFGSQAQASRDAEAHSQALKHS